MQRDIAFISRRKFLISIENCKDERYLRDFGLQRKYYKLMEYQKSYIMIDKNIENCNTSY